MSFFFGGKDNAVPVLVKHIDKLLRDGKLKDTGDDDEDKLVSACCDV